VEESGRVLIEGTILAGRNEESRVHQPRLVPEPLEYKSQFNRLYSEGGIWNITMQIYLFIYLLIYLSVVYLKSASSDLRPVLPWLVNNKFWELWKEANMA
jgi:hypothetical protein